MAVANSAKGPVNTADRIRSFSICSVDWAFSSVSNSCNCHNKIPGSASVIKLTSASLGYPLSVFNKNSTLKGPEERDHLLSIEVTSLDGAPSLLAFVLI